MKLLLFSDLHLDVAYAWAPTPVARMLRRHLQDTLDAIVDREVEVGADAVLCGGDLYEHDRFSPDTAEFVRGEFERLGAIPVYVSPGNHDWYGPESLYERYEFSSNVHIFRTDRLAPVELTDGVTLWGSAHRAPANTDNFLEGFRVDRGGVNLALFHGSEQGAFHFQGDGKEPHAPFTAGQIADAGLAHAFLGHYHTPSDEERFTYPGNPCPLTFGESGERGIVTFELRGDGTLERTRETVARGSLCDRVVDLSGCVSQQEVRDRVDETLRELEGCVRLTLTGDVDASVDLQASDLTTPDWLDHLAVRRGALRVAYDFDSLAREPTVRGRFVQDVLAEVKLSEEERRAILTTGLRALDGRSDLEVL